MAAAAEKGEAVEPDNLLRGDAIGRLINNGTVQDVQAMLEEKGELEFGWKFHSDDPALTFEELDRYEHERDVLRQMVGAQLAAEKQGEETA